MTLFLWTFPSHYGILLLFSKDCHSYVEAPGNLPMWKPPALPAGKSNNHNKIIEQIPLPTYWIDQSRWGNHWRAVLEWASMLSFLQDLPCVSDQKESLGDTVSLAFLPRYRYMRKNFKFWDHEWLFLKMYFRRGDAKLILGFALPNISMDTQCIG